MKVALLFFFALAGFVSANPVPDVPEYAIFEEASDEVLKAFADELNQIALSDSEDETEEIQSEVIDKLREALKETLEEIKKRIDEQGKKADEFIKKAEELALKLKELNVDVGKKVRDALNRLSDKARQHLRRLIDLIKGKRPKRSLKGRFDLHRKGEMIAQRVCKALARYVPEERKNEVETTCKNRIMELTEFLEKLVGEGHDKLEADSIKDDLSEAVRKFFRDFKLKFSKKYANFAEWLKEAYKKGLGQAKDKMEHLKEVAREVKKSVKEMKEEALKEAMAILEPYKKQLGELWHQLVEAAKEALRRKKEEKAMLEKLDMIEMMKVE